MINVKVLERFKKAEEDTNEKGRKAVDLKELEIYSGMRVVVETPDGDMLFIGDLRDPYGGTAKLCQCSGGEGIWDRERVHGAKQMHVRLRGYNNHKRKAVLMEGIITLGHHHIWQIEKLTVTKVENERTFHRLNTDMDAVIAAAEGENGEERHCRLLNISAGGANISSEYRYHKGDTFLLKVKLLEKESEAVLYCEVLRVAEKGSSRFEYGCRFLELAKADEERMARGILDLELKEKEKGI